MSIEANHWHRVDQAHEEAGAAVDARELAIAAKVDAFHEHAGVWIKGEYLGWDRAYELVWASEAYTEHYRASQQATGSKQERLAKEYLPLLRHLLDTAVETIATLAVDQDIEDAA